MHAEAEQKEKTIPDPNGLKWNVFFCVSREKQVEKRKIHGKTANLLAMFKFRKNSFKSHP